MNRSTLMFTTISALAFLSLSNDAKADDARFVEDSGGRSGLTAGIALGFGHLGCEDEDCDGLVEAGGISAHLGVMLTPKLALIADVWGMAHRAHRSSFDQTILTAGLRFWPVDLIWLSGGVGVARASFTYDAGTVQFTNRSETVPGFMAAVGIELLHTPKLALDLQVRAGTGIYDEDQRLQSYAVAIGASFY